MKKMSRSIFEPIYHLLSRPKALLILLFKVCHSLFLWLYVVLVFIVGDLFIPVIILFAKDKKEIPHIWLRYASKLLFYLAFIPVKIEGLDNIPTERPLIILPNHQGHFDYPIMFMAIPFRFSYIAKKELFALPIFGRYFRIAGFYMLDRNAAMSAYNTMEEVGEAMKTGDSILIFPEGTRTENGSVGEFKGGALKLAYKLGVPILPVAISGSFGIMRKLSWIVNSKKVKIKIGKPIYFQKNEEVDLETYKKAIQDVHAVVAKLLEELEAENKPAAKA